MEEKDAIIVIGGTIGTKLVFFCGDRGQGCQIFLGTKYQKLEKIYQTTNYAKCR
jgi:hypothetical protein